MSRPARRAAGWSALALAALAAAPSLALAGAVAPGGSGGPKFTGWWALVALVVAFGLAALLIAWGLRRQGRTPRGRLARLLGQARALSARRGNDFSQSPWADPKAAAAEINGLRRQVYDGRTPHEGIARLILPSGPLGELAARNGWSDEFMRLAGAIDVALALVPGA